jgi:hypothetical protein
LGIRGPATVHDLWSHKELGSMDLGFTANLSTHASRMIHVIPASSLIISPKSGAIEVDPSYIALKWNDQPDADKYHVLVATDSGFTNIVADQTTSSSTLNVENLKTDIRYYWKVSSILSGTEKQIGIYSFHTKMTTAPAETDWIMAKRKNNHSVLLTWNPVFGTSSYTVYRKDVKFFGSSSYTPIASNLTDPNYVDKTAKKGVKYLYFVTAKNAIGESGRSVKAQIEGQTSAKMETSLIVLFSLMGFAIIFTIARINNKYSRSI